MPYKDPKLRQRQRKNKAHTKRYSIELCPACDYSLDMTGLPDDLAAVQDFLAPAMRQTRGYCPGDVMLDLTRLYNDIHYEKHHDAMIGIVTEVYRSPGVANLWGAEEHYSFGVGSAGVFEWSQAAGIRPANDAPFEGGTWERGTFRWSSDRLTMRIAGRSWMGPPVKLASRLSRRFPSVRFEMSGVTFDLFERPLPGSRLADVAASGGLAAFAK